jgi:glutathione-regulated potassium-efflux system protein KefB
MSMLLQATIFLGAAVILVPLGRRFGLASVLGYLLTGIVLGPSLFNVAGDTEAVMHLAEYGVVMLLFVIGLELQPSRLWALRRSIFMMGGLQVGLTGGLLMLIVWKLFDRPLDSSFVIGFGLALSSTAFVLQLLTEKQQLASTHGRKGFSILLFQDIAVIPLLAILPLLSGARDQHYDLAYFSTVIAVFGGLILASRFVVRPFFRFVALSGATELLTAVALFIVMGVALLMDQLGISMALGAFLTGVLLADSEYRHELEASIEPFKGLLLGLFFMSVGMSTQLNLMITMPVLIIGGAVGLMLIKFAVLALIARLSGQRWPTSVRLGFTLAQGGEFAFVLFNTATQQNVLDASIVAPLNLIVTLSMALTPLSFLLLEKWINPFFASMRPERKYDQIPDNEHQVIIAGFGRVGQIIGRVLRMHNIEFTAIEKSVRQVDFVRKFGNQVYYGDPTNPDLLRAAGIQKARLFILALDDVEKSIRTARQLRVTYPDLIILARARDRQHVYRLREMGVHAIWRDTYLSALDMARVGLNKMGISEEHASRSIELFREYDERLLTRQQAIYDDEAEMLATAKAAATELEGLFDSDQRAKRHQLREEQQAQVDPKDQPS